MDRSPDHGRNSSITRSRSLLASFVPKDELRDLQRTSLAHIAPFYHYGPYWKESDQGVSSTPAFLEASFDLFTLSCLLCCIEDEGGGEYLLKGVKRLRVKIKDLKKRQVEGWELIKKILDDLEPITNRIRNNIEMNR